MTSSDDQMNQGGVQPVVDQSSGAPVTDPGVSAPPVEPASPVENPQGGAMVDESAKGEMSGGTSMGTQTMPEGPKEDGGTGAPPTPTA